MTNCSICGSVYCTCAIQVVPQSPIVVTVTPTSSSPSNPSTIVVGPGQGGAVGAQGTQGVQGRQGLIGTQGIQGTTGTTGSQGTQGIQGTQGTQGKQGTQGIQGTIGRDGNFGGASFDYTYSTTITATDPGVGKVQFNSLILSSATAVYLDASNDASTDISSFLNTIGNSTSTIKGHFRMSKKFDDNSFALFTITSVTNNTGWFTVVASYVSGNGTFTNLDDIVITFARTGDKGDTGVQGTTGTQGVLGLQGTQGIQGLKIGFTYASSAPASPAIGDIWVDSTDGVKYQYLNDGNSSQWVELDSIGYIGAQGIQGNTGTQGTTGTVGFQGIQGTTGTQGTTGSQGIQGVQGIQGTQGLQGTGGQINFPVVSQTSSYTLQASDNGKVVSITTGGVTVPVSIFSAGDSIVIFNNSTSAQTITQGTSVTLRQAATANTGNRTLSQYGVATVLCVTAGVFTISGAGVY